jgi:hypothetical protein
MNYERVRRELIRQQYLAQITKAMEAFDPSLSTVVLLPGGMGSQLDRSEQSFDRAADTADDFDTVWVSAGLFFAGDARTLEIDADGRDAGAHVVRADSELRIDFGPDIGISAYEGAIDFFTDGKNGNYNLLIFGFDWRRSIVECADWLKEFLSMFREQVQDRFGDGSNHDPLAKTTLLAHSQGGLVAKAFVHRVADPGDWFQYLITVGTPFYGTWSQQQRYYQGESLLWCCYSKGELARIVGTLPGLYALMMIDRRTFDTYHEQLGLPADGYPERDQDGNPIDPYDPAHDDRYPRHWFKARYLAEALQTRLQIAESIPDALRSRFFNIRSAHDETPTRLIWKPLPQDYDPERDPPPIEAEPEKDGGDGTVPRWAAFHASAAADNRIDLNTSLPFIEDHPFLLDMEETLHNVKRIVDTGSTAGAKAGEAKLYGDKPLPADRARISTLLSDAGTKSLLQKRELDPALWRGIFGQLMR